MTQARLRIVCDDITEKQKEEIRKYYFDMIEVTYNLKVSYDWVCRQLEHLPDKIKYGGQWYFSPYDYHKLRDLRDEAITPAIG